MTSVRQRGAVIAAAAILVMGSTAAVRAQQWNDRTILTFSSPVMVPGETLQAGTYVFKLADSDMARHTVQVFNESEDKLITTTVAVPVKRLRATNDIVLRFNPTEQGAPPAIKAWFYPGSTYGHQFVYRGEQARQIADRTREIVLTVDVEDSDYFAGRLTTYDPAGLTAEYRGNPETLTEWNTWRKSLQMQAGRASTPSNQVDRDDARQATAQVIQGTGPGQQVSIDDLEDNPERYAGQRVSVDAEVEEIYGPRIFTIDEPDWGDLEGEILVYVPTALAALVQDDDRITVTGTVRQFVLAEIEDEWGWFGLDDDVEVELERRPILVADHIVGGDNDTAYLIRAAAAPRAGAADKPVGTAGDAATRTHGLQTVISGDETLVGDRVSFQAKITGMAEAGGFFVQHGGDTLFVLPSDRTVTKKTGDMVMVEGYVLEMSRRIQERLGPQAKLNSHIYVFATMLM